MGSPVGEIHPGNYMPGWPPKLYIGGIMGTDRITTSGSSTTSMPRRRYFIISGLAVRVLIALVISWLVLMAFFVTSVASH